MADEVRRGLSLRKMADRSDPTPRTTGYDPFTGQRQMVHAQTGAPMPWPLAGTRFEPDGVPPAHTRVAEQALLRWIAEGVIAVEGEDIAHAPGGPAEDPWRVTHTWRTFTFVTFIANKDADGNLVPVRYAVVQNPGKYDDESEASGKRVDHFYDLDLVEG